eukprot:5735790-Pleurochrysis_carterae.AAC.1
MRSSNVNASIPSATTNLTRSRKSGHHNTAHAAIAAASTGIVTAHASRRRTEPRAPTGMLSMRPTLNARQTLT